MRGEVGFMAEWELGVLFGPRLSLICHFVGAYDDVLEAGSATPCATSAPGGR